MAGNSAGFSWEKINTGVAISKVRLVQQSFGFELVLVTHYV